MPERRPVGGFVIAAIVVALIAGLIVVVGLLRSPTPPQQKAHASTTTMSIQSQTSVVVPDLAGMDLSKARSSVKDVGLSLGLNHVDRKSTAAAGTVTAQDPPAGAKVDRGASVELWIAAGPSVLVPDLSGLDESVARTTAEKDGLQLEVLNEVTDEVLPGQVFKQSPAAGERVPPGSRLVVVINGGASSTGGGPGGATDTSLAPGVPPAPYSALAAAFTFPVLYPRTLPPGLQLDPASDNPRQVSEQSGGQGFEVRYYDPGRPEVRLSLLEGDWFEVGDEGDTTVDVRGQPAVVTRNGPALMVGWREGDVSYAVTAEGMNEADVADVARGLQVTPSP